MSSENPHRSHSPLGGQGAVQGRGGEWGREEEVSGQAPTFL